MNKTLIALGVAALAAMPALATQQGAEQKQTARPGAQPHTVPGELKLYEMNSYNGDWFTIDGPNSRVRTEWNIRSVLIHPGDRWQICARNSYRDPCIILDRSVHDATVIGIDNQVGSIRPAPREDSGD